MFYIVIECQKATPVGYGSCIEITTAALQAAPSLFMAASVSELNNYHCDKSLISVLHIL